MVIGLFEEPSNVSLENKRIKHLLRNVELSSSHRRLQTEDSRTTPGCVARRRNGAPVSTTPYIIYSSSNILPRNLVVELPNLFTKILRFCYISGSWCQLVFAACVAHRTN